MIGAMKRTQTNTSKQVIAIALVVVAALLWMRPSATTGSGSSVATSSSQVTNTTAAAGATDASSAGAAASVSVTEDGTYTSKDEVACYIHLYGHLPSNYISKTKARAAGWDSSEGNLDEVLPGRSIGGSTYYNDDGKLPDATGRTWTECDIDYTGGYRGAERIIFSNDGLIYYTGDHYETFDRLY